MSSVSIRLAAVMALFAFAVCLLIGTFSAQNAFSTTVSRALAGMLGTFVGGLIVVAMANRMIQENVKTSQLKSRETPSSDR